MKLKADVAASSGSRARLVRLHFFGDDFKGIVELPEGVALTVIQSAADPRLASILAMVAENERESDPEERENIRRTLVEIMKNASVLTNDKEEQSPPGGGASKQGKPTK